MSNWSTVENEIIIRDYFEMLSSELSGKAYSKTAYRKNVLKLIPDRTEGSIEFKHQNISAALIKLGLPYIPGYLPRYNYQKVIEEKVVEYLMQNKSVESYFEHFADKELNDSLSFQFEKMLVKSPAIERIEEPEAFYSRSPIKINYLEREQSNAKLGFLGEKLILNYEKWNLKRMGKDKLAEQVEWIAHLEGDGAGFDILSKNSNGSDKYVEVKTTKLSKKTPFFFSRNELMFSEQNAENYHLYRLFNFENQAQFFIKIGGLNHICQSVPISYKGYF